MRITYPTALNSQYLDRSPVWLGDAEDVSLVGPHAALLRFDYTIPADRRGVIEGAFMHVYREAVAAPIGLVSMVIWGSQGGFQTILGCINTIDNAIGDQKTLVIPGPYNFLPGTRIRVQTFDLGVGGTNHYVWSINLYTYTV